MLDFTGLRRTIFFYLDCYFFTALTVQGLVLQQYEGDSELHRLFHVSSSTSECAILQNL